MTATKLKKPATIEPGSEWREINRPAMPPVRVMAYVDGYILARYEGRAPFVEHWRDWLRVYEPAEQAIASAAIN